MTHADDVHGRIRQFLGDHDIRYTRGRQAVVRSLERAGGPRSAAELHAKLRSVPLSSLYRSLAILDGAGVLRKHHDADGLARFELAEWLGGHHHHLVCVECGEVQDIDLGEENETELRRIAGRVAAAAGYHSTGHILEVEGLCTSCRP